MPKKYYQWQVHVWCSVYHLIDEVWVWSHVSSNVESIRAETEDDARNIVVPTLRPETTDAKNGIKVTSQYIYNVYCRGAMKKVTEWQVTDKDARPGRK